MFHMELLKDNNPYKYARLNNISIYGNKRDDIKKIRDLFIITHNIAYEIGGDKFKDDLINKKENKRGLTIIKGKDDNHPLTIKNMNISYQNQNLTTLMKVTQEIAKNYNILINGEIILNNGETIKF